MKHFVIVTLVAIVTLSIVFAVYRPDLLEGAWLWVVGLAGPVIGTVRALAKRITIFFNTLENTNAKKTP